MPKKINRLLVIGAGPKAAAIATKSKVLRHFKEDAPEIWVVDRHEPCANWTGRHGFTNGHQQLGTPPEKDIGFPYIEDHKDGVTEELFRRYSWASYLNFDRRTFGEWIDRGRPAPTHSEWADYIVSVLARAADELLTAKCIGLSNDGDEWVAQIEEERGTRKERFSGVVITGPGEKKKPPFKVADTSRRVQFGDSFWQQTSVLQLAREDNSYPIVVVGGGETAAAIVSYMVDELKNRRPEIIVLTRSGAIFSRGEGYYENRRFTDSSGWRDLPEEVRREVIDRSDRGVFSVETMRKLSNSGRVQHRFLEVTGVKAARSHACVVGKTPKGQVDSLECQLAVLALGFDPYSFIKLLSADLQERLEALGEVPGQAQRSTAVRNREIENAIQDDLSLPASIMPAKLYLPMLSGVSQGPGFPNLSCLGNLSDRILGRRGV